MPDDLVDNGDAADIVDDPRVRDKRTHFRVGPDHGLEGAFQFVELIFAFVDRDDLG